MKKMRFIIVVLSIIFAFQSVNVWADNSYSSWAEDEIKEALSLGLIPEDLQNNYTEAITREEFCILVVNMLDKVSEDIVASGSAIYFDDTDNECVASAAALGIVAGVGNNKFNPNGNITRQEASRMLYMACTLGKNDEGFKAYFSDKLNEMNEAVILPHIFTDGTDIQSWGQESINYCYMYGIMQGVGNNCFDVNGTYSREQAYLTILRVFKLMDIGMSVTDEKTYLYRKQDENLLWSYINEKGEIIIQLDSNVQTLYDFWGGYAVVDSGSLGFSVIDEDGNVIAESLKYGGRYGNLIPLPNENKTLNLKSDKIIGECLPVSEADRVLGEGEYLVPVKDSDSGLYGYYDLEGNSRKQKIYTEAYTFCDGRAIVKYKDSYILLDTDCKTVSEFNLSLKNGEYISSAAGDILIISKESEEKTEFSYAYRVGKGKILTNESGIVSARVMTSGDICVQTADGTYGVYDKAGGKIFENSQNSDIMFEENAGVYRVFSSYTDEIPYYRIISREGSDIVTAAYNKYCEIGNGCFCCINEDTVTIYTANGTVLNTITAESTITDTYSDNGVIFITDKNGCFKAYTYLGEEIL